MRLTLRSELMHLVCLEQTSLIGEISHLSFSCQENCWHKDISTERRYGSQHDVNRRWRRWKGAIGWRIWWTPCDVTVKRNDVTSADGGPQHGQHGWRDAQSELGESVDDVINFPAPERRFLHLLFWRHRNLEFPGCGIWLVHLKKLFYWLLLSFLCLLACDLSTQNQHQTKLSDWQFDHFRFGFGPIGAFTSHVNSHVCDWWDSTASVFHGSRNHAFCQWTQIRQPIGSPRNQWELRIWHYSVSRTVSLPVPRWAIGQEFSSYSDPECWHWSWKPQPDMWVWDMRKTDRPHRGSWRPGHTSQVNTWVIPVGETWKSKIVDQILTGTEDQARQCAVALPIFANG